jgi:hypothetical protein
MIAPVSIFFLPSKRDDDKKKREKKKSEEKRKKREHTYPLSNIYIFLLIYISICTISK